MKRFLKLIKDKELLNSIVNVLLGLLMMVALVVYGVTGKAFWLCPVIICGAMLNVSQGMRFYRKKKTRNMGLSMIMMGMIIVIIVIGLIVATNGEVFK